MPQQVVNCKCHNPKVPLIILPFLTTNNLPFAAICPAEPPTVYIKEGSDWVKKDGWKIENRQIIKSDGNQFQLPESTSSSANEEVAREPSQAPRPAGRKPERGTRIDLRNDDYY